MNELKVNTCSGGKRNNLIYTLPKKIWMIILHYALKDTAGDVSCDNEYHGLTFNQFLNIWNVHPLFQEIINTSINIYIYETNSHKKNQIKISSVQPFVYMGSKQLKSHCPYIRVNRQKKNTKCKTSIVIYDPKIVYADGSDMEEIVNFTNKNLNTHISSPRPFEINNLYSLLEKKYISKKKDMENSSDYDNDNDNNNAQRDPDDDDDDNLYLQNRNQYCIILPTIRLLSICGSKFDVIKKLATDSECYRVNYESNAMNILMVSLNERKIIYFGQKLGNILPQDYLVVVRLIFFLLQEKIIYNYNSFENDLNYGPCLFASSGFSFYFSTKINLSADIIKYIINSTIKTKTIIGPWDLNMLSNENDEYKTIKI